MGTQNISFRTASVSDQSAIFSQRRKLPSRVMLPLALRVPFHSTSPKIVSLLDLKLHTGPGLEVFGRIRVHSMLRCMPVVIPTPSKEEHDLATGYHLGALPPPIQPPPIQDAKV